MHLNVDECIATLQQGECVSEKALRQLCQYVGELLMEESNVQPVLSPVTIVGDLHGQFFDLLNLLKVGGWPPETSYVFLGDFVDRGHNSVETLSLLLCLKLKYPGHVTLLRGNHEVRCCLSCVLAVGPHGPVNLEGLFTGRWFCSVNVVSNHYPPPPSVSSCSPPLHWICSLGYIFRSLIPVSTNYSSLWFL